ncbi:hypothetical protein LDO32_00635 [Luteimonas sp. Y-2-2-4F]|nr:hypothetical protein [Luteimonas sp. Y-2-2-4F]MCD9030242.1 hypothetical protein [Luteimonas sp. Y-2-2-4F]
MENRRPESPPAADHGGSQATAPDFGRDPLDFVRRMQQGGLGAPAGSAGEAAEAFRDGALRERALKQLSVLVAAAGGGGSVPGAQALQGLRDPQAGLPAPQALADLLRQWQAGLQPPGQAGALAGGLRLDGPLGRSVEQALQVFEQATRANAGGGAALGLGPASQASATPADALAQAGGEGAFLGALMEAARRGDALALLAALANLAGSPLALAWAAASAQGAAPTPLDAAEPDAPRQDAPLRDGPAR